MAQGEHNSVFSPCQLPRQGRGVHRAVPGADECPHLAPALRRLLRREGEGGAGAGGSREPAEDVFGAAGENAGQHQEPRPDPHRQAGGDLYVPAPGPGELPPPLPPAQLLPHCPCGSQPRCCHRLLLGSVPPPAPSPPRCPWQRSRINAKAAGAVPGLAAGPELCQPSWHSPAPPLGPCARELLACTQPPPQPGRAEVCRLQPSVCQSQAAGSSSCPRPPPTNACPLSAASWSSVEQSLVKLGESLSSLSNSPLRSQADDCISLIKR